MVIVKPFLAIHYNKKTFKDFRLVTCPSYDYIFEQNREVYLKDSPYNIVSVLSGPDLPGDNGSNKFVRAGKLFRKWLKDEILVKENEQCMYLYEQTYAPRNAEPKTRRGFIAVTLLEEYNKGFMKPHEMTFPNIKETILKLMSEVKADISPIFCIYKRSEMIHDIIMKKSTQKPYVEFFDRKGFIEKLWKIDEINYIKIIENEMRNRVAYIADGHHRYETHIQYREMMRSKTKQNGEMPYDYILTLYVEDNDPGLLCLPTFRLIKDIKISEEKLIERLKEFFDVKEYGNMDGKLVLMEMRSNVFKHAFSIFINHKFYYLTLKDEKMMEKYFEKENSRTWNLLDVNILNRIILEKVLGMKRSDYEQGNGIAYTRWIEKAIARVEQKEFAMAIFLNGTEIPQVIRIADNLEKMPQKSTHFYPKPLTGVVMYDLME